MKKRIAVLLSLSAALCAPGLVPGTTSVMADETENASSGRTELVVGLSQDLDNSLDPYQITAAGTREV